jgi:regulator of cell morphogenesis and NO signaling
MLATHAPTIGDLVANRPELASLFESLGIDFCCGGRRTLEDACREAGLDYPSVLARVQAIEANSPEAPSPMPSLASLCEQIVETHHHYLRRQFPLIERLLEKVLAAHQTRHPELVRLQRVFTEFAFELRRHMAKEEQVLFPAIARLETDRRFPAGPFGSIRNPIAAMEHEHDSAGDELGMMRGLTAGFVPPPDACPTYRALITALADLEQDMHRHVHLENNVLFPAALRLEEELSRTVGQAESSLKLPRA